jgi:hypothetical protein
MRHPNQLSKKFYYSESGPYLHQYTDMISAFAPFNPSYVSSSLILFSNATDLGNAVKALEIAADSTSQYANANASLLDLGRNVYLGIVGKESAVFTYSLIFVTRFNLSGDTPYFVLTGTAILDPDTKTALGSYGVVLTSG